jgi:uroporphyrinogen-III synthase
MRLLVTRPQPDADAQAEKLKGLGHDVIVAPLLDVEFLDFAALPLSGAQGLIVTSRNALRALNKSSQLKDTLLLPLFTVGEATANMARELGFENIHQGPGTAEEMAPLITSECQPGAGSLIHLAGERMAFDLKSALEDKGFEVIQPILYRINMGESFAGEARKAHESRTLEGVIVMSPATAQTYMALVAEPELQVIAKKLTFFCLSHKVAEPLKALGDARVLIAATPKEDDLLALIDHEAAHW